MRKNCYGLLTPSSEAANIIHSMASLRKDEWNTTAYIFKCQRDVLKMISQVETILAAEAWIKVKILSRIYVINGIFKSNRICPNGGERLLFRNSPNLILVWKRSLPQQPHKYMRFWKVAFCTSAEKSLRTKKKLAQNPFWTGIFLSAMVWGERPNVGGHVVLEQVQNQNRFLLHYHFYRHNHLHHHNPHLIRRDDLNMMVEGAWNLGVTGEYLSPRSFAVG